ncbi:MAG: hypothetical protein ACI4QR_04685, partial [Eubacteriales bacterium]
MKAMRKIVPALAMLLVSLVVMSSASFAWFTMSRQVTAQGMNVTVTAPNNLMIKEAGADDNTYAEITKITVSGISLFPASTVNGNDIFFVKDGEAVDTNTGELFGADDPNGHKQTKLEKATTAASDGAPGAYYDFKYKIKSDGGQNVNVVVKSIKITDNGVGTDHSTKPVRIAVICDGSAVLYNAGNGTNHTANNAVSAINGEGYPTISSVTYVTPATNSSDTHYVAQLDVSNPEKEITIRVWYEGEDTECTIKDAAKADFGIEVVLA